LPYCNCNYNMEETKEITQIIDKDARLLIKCDKDKFLNIVDNYRIVHTATHANVDVYHPENSNIVFNDGVISKLYAKDIYTHQINPELLVLSACQTAKGKLKKGEGVMSLSRAFLASGTKSVISSYWSVNDKSTKEIMIDFYSNLKGGKQKHHALRNAKLVYLDKMQVDKLYAPKYWASFASYGDDHSIYKKSYPKTLLLLVFIPIFALMCFSVISRK
ncbi:MAG: CHAT domain-containing protein, partial [Bacteroidota bacterium]